MASVLTPPASNDWPWSVARITYGGSVPVGVVYTGIMALVDPLPEDGAGDGLVGQQQTYHLHVINNHQSIR